ncbi:MAG: rhodanese-like domain-containing protein [Bdellovibrionales bacterium]
MNLNSIGFFQFDNLIKNRIPFVLINLTQKPVKIYSQSLYQQHLTQVEVMTTTTEVLPNLNTRQHPKHEALLVLCEDGSHSPALVQELEQSGYLNVFYVEGGLSSLMADALR